MAVGYQLVQWNPQKKSYDKVMIYLMVLYLVLFVLFQLLFSPDITIETLIIRATGTLAFLMLHVILCIGPLSRLNDKFLPLLYNRRHLGVSMFLIALIHGIFNLIQFHALGNVNPLLSLFTSNLHYNSLINFPFQVLGFFALGILFLMASTSHDFWLKNLSPKVWKSLHMLVYLAYALLIGHVVLGSMQTETGWGRIFIYAFGLISIITLHLLAAFKNLEATESRANPFVEVCNLDEIPEKRAKIVLVEGENIAVFKYDGKVSAVSNICRHQHGPLGEGKIVDGCITCPWHGYQYLPHNGQSPPPFDEKIETYDVKIENNKVLVNINPHPEGTECIPALITS